MNMPRLFRIVGECSLAVPRLVYFYKHLLFLVLSDNNRDFGYIRIYDTENAPHPPQGSAGGL